MKSVLISIRPEWCQLIADGKKTIEVRKTRPKLKTPFKCYIYCTVGNKSDTAQQLEIHSNDGKIRKCNGMVMGEFVCDKITMDIIGYKNDVAGYWCLDGSCLSQQELNNYANNKILYGWHISDLKIYDKPRELNNYTKYGYTDECPQQLGEIKNCKYNEWDMAEDSSTCAFDYDFRIDKCPYCRLKKAPQSWCYVEEIL